MRVCNAGDWLLDVPCGGCVVDDRAGCGTEKPSFALHATRTTRNGSLCGILHALLFVRGIDMLESARLHSFIRSVFAVDAADFASSFFYLDFLPIASWLFSREASRFSCTGFSKIWDPGFFFGLFLTRLTLCLFPLSEGFSASSFPLLSRAALIISCEYLFIKPTVYYREAHPFFFPSFFLFFFFFFKNSLDHHHAILAEEKRKEMKRKEKKRKWNMPTEPAATSCSLAADLNPPVSFARATVLRAVLYAFCQQRAWKEHAGRHPYVTLNQSRRRVAIRALSSISSRVRLPAV